MAEIRKNRTVDVALITQLATEADTTKTNWERIYKSQMTFEEAVELAYLAVPLRKRHELFPDYRLVELIAVERLKFWQNNRLKKTAA